MDNFDKMYSLFLRLEEELMNATVAEDVLAICKELERLALRGQKNVEWEKRLDVIEFK